MTNMSQTPTTQGPGGTNTEPWSLRSTTEQQDYGPWEFEDGPIECREVIPDIRVETIYVSPEIETRLKKLDKEYASLYAVPMKEAVTSMLRLLDITLKG